MIFVTFCYAGSYRIVQYSAEIEITVETLGAEAPVLPHRALFVP